jgi:hypothetical protein
MANTRSKNRVTKTVDRKPKRQSQKRSKSKPSGNESRADTKAGTVLGLLKRKTGATLAELVAATGWQPHSVRGFMSGTVRKRMALVLVSEATDDGRRYRIEQGGQQPASS